MATNEYRTKGQEKSEYHPVVTWDRLAEICAQYIGKGQQVAIEGRLQTRQWEDEHKLRHWKTEVVAHSVEMLSGRRKRDYATEAAAESLEAQASRFGVESATPDEPDPAVPADEPIAEGEGAVAVA